MRQFLNDLKAQLQQPLPGEMAQYRLAPRHRQRLELDKLKAEEFRPSAVMILFCEDSEGKLFIPLTERMAYKGAHSAQISLPGGKFDNTDRDLQFTAERECFEEIGISEIETIGKLTRLFIPVSNFLVHPFVGACKVIDPQMKIHEREVKSVLRLYMEDLLDDAIMEEGKIHINETLIIETPWFNVHGHRVWGATAMILSELKEVLIQLKSKE